MKYLYRQWRMPQIFKAKYKIVLVSIGLIFTWRLMLIFQVFDERALRQKAVRVLNTAHTHNKILQIYAYIYNFFSNKSFLVSFEHSRS